MNLEDALTIACLAAAVYVGVLTALSVYAFWRMRE